MADQTFKIHRLPALASVGYATVGALWILSSDNLLELVIDPAHLSHWQTLKGLAFVAVTAAVLFVLLRTVCREAPPLLREYPDGAGKGGLLLPLAVYLMLILALGFTGYFVFREQRLETTRSSEESLSAVALLRVDQITMWLRERTRDAQLMAGNSFLAQQVEKWTAAPTPGEEQLIRSRLAGVRARSNYHNVLLLDRQANLRLAFAEEANPVTPEDRQLARQAMRQGKPLLSDLYVIPETQTARVDFVAPLMVRHGDRDVIVGVLLLRVDPRIFLYPLTRSLPASSGSAETLLVRREGNNALFLDNVPGRPATALTLGPPPDLPAATATGGMESIAEGVDYRGARVLAAIRPVPGVPWYIVAKIDQSEVYAPISALALAGGSLLGVFIITAGLVLVLWWRDQSIRQAFARFRDEQERQALLQHLDYLSRYANDIIILVDEDGRIVEANDRAAEAYGYSREELIGLEERQLRAPETQAAFETDWRELEEQNARVYETIHVRHDGTTFPVEISARVIEVDRKRFRQSIIRDITERKTAQSKLEQHLDELLRFQRLTVGRELRMKELAEENQRLREQLGEAAKPDPPR